MAPIPAATASDGLEVNLTSASDKEVTGERGRFERVQTVPKGAQVVKIGIEPVEVYEVDLVSGTWGANFEIWWRWTGEIDPTETTYFTNNASTLLGSEITYDYLSSAGKPEPKVLSSGEKYQRAIVQLGFVEDFELERFPLDRQFLRIRIENEKWDSNRLFYEFDQEHLSPEKKIPINGWVSVGTQLSSYIHHYGTDFGDIDEGLANQDYSQLVYSMEIKRNESQFYLKLLFPLMIVLIASYAALAIRQLAGKSPLSIASTGLLTVLFSQQLYSKDLPPQAPLVLIDKIYLAGLLSVLLVFIRVVYRTHHKKSDGDFDELKLFMGRKTDLYYGFFVAAVFTILTTILINA